MDCNTLKDGDLSDSNYGTGCCFMKRMIVAFIVWIIVFILSITIALASDNYISIGDFNEDVLALHQKLSVLGYYKLRTESPWSEASVDALRSFQIENGLDETGVIESIESLERILSPEFIEAKNLLLGTNQGTTNYSIS